VFYTKFCQLNESTFVLLTIQACSQVGQAGPKWNGLTAECHRPFSTTRAAAVRNLNRRHSRSPLCASKRRCDNFCILSYSNPNALWKKGT
jgi:hypothetical protein